MHLTNLSPSWFALRVRTKSELLVNSLLQNKGYEAFTPTYLERRPYSDRIRKVDAALFPGYVFCRFQPADLWPVVNTPAVQKVLTVAGQPAVISDCEIEAVRRTAEAGNARPHPYLNIGQRVRVQTGALTGVEGLLISFKGSDRLVISAHLLQRALSVELDGHQVVAL